MNPYSWVSVPLHIDVEIWDDSVAVVTCDGDVDVPGSKTLKASLVELEEQGFHRFVVDLSRVTFIEATGFGVLFGALKRVKSVDGSLDLVCDQEAILQFLKSSDLIRVFRVFGSPAVARRFMGT